MQGASTKAWRASPVIVVFIKNRPSGRDQHNPTGLQG